MRKHHHIPSLLVVLIVCTLVSACKVGQNYQRPELVLPEKYRDEIDPADTIGIGNIYWKDFFVDTTLQKLIDSAIVNNYDMRKALRTVQIAEQIMFQNRAQFLPSITGQLAEVGRDYRSSNALSTPSSRYYADRGRTAPKNGYIIGANHITSISLSWEADIWGKIRRQNESALADYLETYEARKLLQTQLVADVAEGYYNLLMLDAQMEVAKRNLRLNDSTLRIVKLQRDAGEPNVTSLAIQQTENQRLTTAALIPQLERQMVIQENTLRALAGQLPDSISRIASISDFIIEDSVSAGVPLYMIGHRPDVRAAELALRSKNAQVGVAQAYRYPSLTIDVEGGLNSMLPSNWVKVPGSLFGNIVGGLTQPIFQQRRLKTNYEVAKLEREQAELDFQQIVLDAINEVTNTLITLKKLAEEYEIGEQRVKVSQLGVQQANLLFKAGYATYLEVITAQQNAIDSELELNELRQQQLIARVELYRALGGGWQAE